MAARFAPPPPQVYIVLQEELESVQKCAARFVTGNYSITVMKLGVRLAFLDSWNGNPSRKGGQTIDLYCYIKVLKVKPVYQQMTLSPKPGVLEISTLSMAFQTPIANTDVYKGSPPPQTIRDWNALPDSLISSAEYAEDCVAKQWGRNERKSGILIL